MCLFTHLGEARTANKDITCYKIVYPGDSQETPSDVFKSLMMKFHYKIGVTYEEPEFNVTSEEPDFEIDDKKGREVHKGFHSYRKLSEAAYWVSGRHAILKCVIPAGSKYYYDPNKNYYCSNKLKIVAWRQPFMKPRAWSMEQYTNADIQVHIV